MDRATSPPAGASAEGGGRARAGPGEVERHGPSVIVTVARTTDVDPHDRFDYWRESISSAIAPLDARAAPRPGFRGQLRSATAGAAHLIDVVADPHCANRTKQLIDGSPSGFYKVSAQLLGRAVLRQGTRTAHLEPGDFAIYDPDQPYNLTFDTAHHQLVVMCPKEMLRVPRRELDPLLARPISRNQPMGTLVFAFLAELARHFDSLESVDGVRLGDNVTSLLTSLLLEQMSGAQLAANRRTLFMQVTTYIEQHLGDPSLCPEQIAAAHGYSTRALHRLFHDSGRTVAGWIRERRLEHCRRDLRDPTRDGISIRAIGSRWGFADAAHFSRVFKAAFGVSPRAFRCGCGDEQADAARSL